MTRKRTRRKEVVLVFQFIGYGLALCLGMLPFVFSSQMAMDLLLLIFFLSVSLLSVAGNAWIGWISDIVPRSVRGRFFTTVSQYVTLTAIGAGLGFSLFMDYFSDAARGIHGRVFTFFRPENLPLGFVAVFIVAVAASFYWVGALSRLPEKDKVIEKESIGGIFFQPVRDSNFRKFLVYNCWWMFAVGIGAPFWQPFMFQRLRLPSDCMGQS